VPEAFFGPWLLEATTAESVFFERFVIAGTDGVDGIYEPDENGTPTQLSVTGEEWTIDLQARFGEEGDWFSYEPVRTTRFVPHEGLMVWLGSELPIEPSGDVFAHLLVLRCVSTDPALNPPLTPNPFDFTLPKG
jgi:hypothetical protein